MCSLHERPSLNLLATCARVLVRVLGTALAIAAALPAAAQAQSSATSLASFASSAASASSAYAGIGRPATPAEVAAWDIDVRPDFKGLPKGSGTVAQGMDVWESKCASCHGVFGESNQTFSPLVGGTTADDIKTGHVARLNDAAYPGRTTLMKASTLSTLWDYINRAMPWNAPKSLKPDEVYAVTAYMLNLGGIVPDNFTLSDATMADAQKLLPNRSGMTTAHALWPGKSLAGTTNKPDVQATACMRNCAPANKVVSLLPDFARNAHGNLAEQNRLVGAQHGADTTRPAPTVALGSGADAASHAGATPALPSPAAQPSTPDAAAASASTTPNRYAAAMAVVGKNACTICHAVSAKIVGPSFQDVAKKYAGRADAESYLIGKIRSGGSGVWGATLMPTQTLSEADAQTIAQWLAAGAKK